MLHPASLFDDVDHETATPCPICLGLAKEGELRAETVMPLPRCPPRNLANRPCCHDCEAAEGLLRMGVVPGTFWMARVAVANDRQAQLRLPGVPKGLVAHALMRPNRPGDLEKHLAWMQRFPELMSLPE